MLANNPNANSNGLGDQAKLQQLVVLSKQARLFYQRAASATADHTIRRYFTELALLHQQAEKIITAQPLNAAMDIELSRLCQWYQHQNTAPAVENWLPGFTEQLSQQVTVLKRFSRGFARPEHVTAIASLTASLQIVADQLIPILEQKKHEKFTGN